jgi:outer membrane protein OmpA-like peptidoglycan-associated protein
MRTLLIGIGLIAFAVLPARGQSAEAPPPDTIRTQVQTQRSAPAASGLWRVRQRIAQIRGQQSTASSSVLPIIVIPPGQSAATQQVPAMQPAPRSAPSANAQPGVTQADLNRFETRLMRRLELLFEELYADLGASAQQAPNVIVRPQQPPLPADSLRAAPPEPTVVDSVRIVDSVRVAPRPGQPPTVVEVRRALLDAGLFRALDVNFETGSATLPPRAERSLAAIGEVLAQYPAVRVEIAGYTDSTGPEALNQQLSERRAAAVRDYLIDNYSIAPDRLTARGYGEAQPIATNDTRTGRALNRRVEFRVLNPEAAERVLDTTSTDTTEARELEEIIRRTIEEEMQQRGAPPDTSGGSNQE